MNLWFILGEGFSVYAKATNSLLVKDFLSQEIKNKPYAIGQGLSLSEYQKVLNICAEQDIELLNAVNYSNSASLTTTHKHNQENVLISKPKQLKENIYLSELIIFQNNELIIDHQTGLHIQGMVLIEGIRQMFIAVVEKYFAQNKNLYIVFNNLKVGFQYFTFPFKVQIKQEIINRIMKKNGAVLYESKFEVTQLETTVLQAHTSYTVYDSYYMEIKEKEIAEKIILQLKNKG